MRAILLSKNEEEEILQLLLEGPQMSRLQVTKEFLVFTSNRLPNRTQSLVSLLAVLIWDITKSQWVNLFSQLILSWCNRIKFQTRRKTCSSQGNRSQRKKRCQLGLKTIVHRWKASKFVGSNQDLKRREDKRLTRKNRKSIRLKWWYYQRLIRSTRLSQVAS